MTSFLTTTINLPLQVWVLFLVAGVAALLFLFYNILLAFILIKTPAGKFLKAFFTRKPLFFVISEAQQAAFFVPKKWDRNGAELSLGTFGITKNSHVLELKSRVPVFLAFSDFGITLNNNFTRVLHALKYKYDIPINDISDYEKVLRKEDLTNEKGEVVFNFDTAAQDIKNEIIRLDSNTTVKFHELKGMFPFNINPSFIESKIQANRAIDRRKMAFNQGLAVTVGIFIILAGIGFYMISRAKAPNVVCEVALKDAVQNGVQLIAQNVTM